MPKICYQKKKFKTDALNIIAKANEILAEYDMDLTLRQLYYQFVSRDILPNKVESYNKLGNIVNDARLAGLIDWDRIQDLTRELRGTNVWGSPGEIIGAVARQYRFDKWKTQPFRPEIWVEKDALRTVIERACEPLNIPFFACRGYVSQSEMWQAAQRMLLHRKRGQEPIVIHLGDHDPSGIDMTRDIAERLTLFGMRGLQMKRIALNMDQVEEYSPPPNPAKTTDARFAGYQSTYGDESWELDALDPATLIELITKEVASFTDKAKMKVAEATEKKHRTLLRLASENWDELSDHIAYTYPEEKRDADDEEATEDEADEETDE